MANFEIVYKHNGHEVLCTEEANGHCWCFTMTEEQAKERVADLATIGITAWYERIGEKHWVNDWIG